VEGVEGVKARGVAWRGGAGRGVAWRGVAWRGVAWRGEAWRGVAWGVAWRGVARRVRAGRGVAWRGGTWRGGAWRGVAWRTRNVGKQEPHLRVHLLIMSIMPSHARCWPAALSSECSSEQCSKAHLRNMLTMFTLRPIFSLCNSALCSGEGVGCVRRRGRRGAATRC
jgi:hypothetical protein